MVIHQGDVLWVDFGTPAGSEPGFERPAVVVQSDLYNRTAIRTVCVAVITSNIRLAASPGNIRLAKGEANLPKPSVINITLLKSIDRARIKRKLGTITKARRAELLQGLAILFSPTEA